MHCVKCSFDNIVLLNATKFSGFYAFNDAEEIRRSCSTSCKYAVRVVRHVNTPFV
jgi:hypothetical protein